MNNKQYYASQQKLMLLTKNTKETWKKCMESYRGQENYSQQKKHCIQRNTKKHCIQSNIKNNSKKYFKFILFSWGSPPKAPQPHFP